MSPTPPLAVVPAPESLWDARDVAAFLKVSRSWVYQHAEDGTLPSVKFGGLRRFVPSAVRAWALAGAAPATPAAAYPPAKGR